MNKIFVNGIGIYPFKSKLDVIDFISVRKGILVAVNAEKIVNATDTTRKIINNNVGYADGIGAVLAIKKYGILDAVKIPGCELWLSIVDCLSRKNKTFYLVGSKQEVIEKVVEKLKFEFPSIQIVGFRNGYIKDEKERCELIENIVEQKPDVVFVAMGSPRQELLMQDMSNKHNAIYQGLGGSFDVYVGNVERAPQWWLKHNLEFAYRLIKQPKRLFRQLSLIKFLFFLYTGRYK